MTRVIQVDTSGVNHWDTLCNSGCQLMLLLILDILFQIEEFEKGVLLYALYRLHMIAGKTIIFVNSVNKGYKLRMFLGQFGIASCILNCELPGNSRCDIIEQFNAGRYDTIIATDETSLDSDAAKFKLNE